MTPEPNPHQDACVLEGSHTRHSEVQSFHGWRENVVAEGPERSS